MTILAFTPPPTAPVWSVDTVAFPKLFGRSAEVFSGRAKVPTAPATSTLPAEPKWCTDHVDADGDHHHRSDDRTVEVSNNSFRRVDGRRVNNMVDVSVNSEWFVHADQTKYGYLQERPSINLSIDHSDGVALTPEVAREFAGNVLICVAELEGEPTEPGRLHRLVRRVFPLRKRGHGRRWQAGYEAGLQDTMAKVEEAGDSGYTDGYLKAMRVYRDGETQ